MGHGHTHSHGGDDSRKLLWSIILTGAILVAEIIGGIMANSLALLADAGHVFMDVFALSLSLGAIAMAKLPATGRRTYGWHRAEVFAALINGTALFVIAFFILHEAYERITAPESVDPLPMMTVAVAGLLVNVAVAVKLHGHDRNDLNVRSAYLHVIGDMLGSVAVVAGGIVIIFTGWNIVDPLLSVGIVLLIVFGAFRLLRETLHILLEGMPYHIDADELRETVLAQDGITHMHDLHVWSVCSHITCMSAHVEIRPEFRERRQDILHTLRHMLKDRYRITHTTFEVDERACREDMIAQDLHHHSGGHHHEH